MAQTKRKRQTKHRGNAAGVIEARGRTGRGSTGGKDKEKVPRRDRPPSWGSAFTRAAIATLALLVVAGLFIKGGSRFLFFFPIVLGAYTGIGYYTDKFLYDRRQRQKAAGKVKA